VTANQVQRAQHAGRRASGAAAEEVAGQHRDLDEGINRSHHHDEDGGTMEACWMAVIFWSPNISMKPIRTLPMM